MLVSVSHSPSQDECFKNVSAICSAKLETSVLKFIKSVCAHTVLCFSAGVGW